MQFGLGVLRFPPDVFWRMTFREFMMALEGYAMSKGGKDKGKAAPGAGGEPMTRARLLELHAMYPDRPNPRAKNRPPAAPARTR